MKRIIILLILCLLAVGMIYSCTLQHEVEPTPMPTPQPCYVLEYTKGVTIQRRIENASFQDLLHCDNNG